MKYKNVSINEIDEENLQEKLVESKQHDNKHSAMDIKEELSTENILELIHQVKQLKAIMLNNKKLC